MLVLLCPNCQHLTHEGPGVQCVLCLKRKARVAGEPAGQPEVEEAEGGETGRKLRILCLHGFRQTAKQFKVRRDVHWPVLFGWPFVGVLFLILCVSAARGTRESLVG